MEEDMLIDYALIIGTGYVIGELLTPIVYKKLQNKEHHKQLSQYELLVGYNKKHDIIIDMKIVPHVLIGGLSNNGKSKCAELMLQDKLNVVLLNCYCEDFTSLTQAKRINDVADIEAYLKSLIESDERYKIPLYVCIDELLMLCRYKTINDLIMQLLATGRHKNIFILSLVQIATKTNLPFKDLHNTRITFKQLEPSAYKVICPSIPEGVKTDLKQREFIIYYQDGVENGVTYDV